MANQSVILAVIDRRYSQDTPEPQLLPPNPPAGLPPAPPAGLVPPKPSTASARFRNKSSNDRSLKPRRASSRSSKETSIARRISCSSALNDESPDPALF